MNIVHVTEENFEQEVLNADKPVLVDFWATWCGPCQMLAPILEEFANEHNDVKVCKVDVTDEQNLAVKYDVSAIPTLILFKNGKVANTQLGFMGREQIEEFIKK